MADDRQPLSIRFPAALYERMRKAAYERHESMTAIVLRGTERELDDPQHDPETSKEQDHG
jgi:hypothetical protein